MSKLNYNPAQDGAYAAMCDNRAYASIKRNMIKLNELQGKIIFKDDSNDVQLFLITRVLKNNFKALGIEYTKENLRKFGLK